MNILCASDSFKGSLSSEKIIALVREASRCVFDQVQVKGVRIADGGEGTVDAVVSAVDGAYYEYADVCGPLGDRVSAKYGILHGNKAIIEMAQASGLTLIDEKEKNPMLTSTYGTGQLIMDAYKKGVRDFYIAIGGSATNDGGMGAMKALGVEFFDADGLELKGIGADLIKVASVDVSGLDLWKDTCSFYVLCDVTNPLIGPDGATYTFSAQKGADANMQKSLEEGMCNYSHVLETCLGKDVSVISGGGAAGGLGAALMAFLGAKMSSGIETVLDLIGFDQLLDDADLVITGEGRMDWQSAFGKAVSGVGLRCKKKHVPVIAIVGSVGKDAHTLLDYGITSIMTIVNDCIDVKTAMECAKELYVNAAEQALRMVKIGIEMK